MIRIKYYTGCKKPAEAAKYAGVSERTLKSWYSKGLPHNKINSRLTLINGKALEEWCESHQQIKDKPITINERANELLKKTIGK
ncbi:putative DNA binding domain protein, excisionase family [Desulfosarcina variabilis str. Montpellier]|uniref:helix-turn-helix domain-containing protein n=1 Tax=Desulfosarcina variabilis TaxID=2300 RepID=UPI003AFB178D